MKVICQGLELSDAVLKVTKALNNKVVSPILEGIKVSAKGDSLVLFATDLELAIEKKINAEVLLEGEVIVPGRFFADIVKMLANEQIELSLDDNLRLKIKYTDGEIEKQCFSVDEYPEIKKPANALSFDIVSKEYKDLISKTIFSVSTDDTRPTLKGCLFEAEEYTISSVALDGYRLAMVKKPLERKLEEKIKVIVPARSLSELNKFLEDSEDIISVKIENNLIDEATALTKEFEALGFPENVLATVTGLIDLFDKKRDTAIMLMDKTYSVSFTDRLGEIFGEFNYKYYLTYNKNAKREIYDAYYTFMSSGFYGTLKYWIENPEAISKKEITRLTYILIKRLIVPGDPDLKEYIK